MTDIRVIFKPEGVGEILDGLRQMRREAVATERAAAALGFGGVAAGTSFVDLFSKKGPEAAGKFSASLTSVAAIATRLVPALGFVGAVSGLVSLGRTSLQTAADVGKLREQFKLTATDITTLTFAARRNEATAEDLERGLAGLAKSQRELRAGAEDVVAAYADLNLTAKDFQGLNLAQSLELIAKRMQGIDPNLIDLDKVLGRQARRLIPTLNELADKGLAGVRKEGEAMGVVLGDKAVDGTKRLKNEMETAGERASGLANILTGHLAGAAGVVVAAFNNMLERLQQLASGNIFAAILGEYEAFLRMVGIKSAAALPGTQEKKAGGVPEVDEAERRRIVDVSRKQANEQFKLLEEETKRRRELAEAAIEGERLTVEARNAGAENQIKASQEVLNADAKAFRERVQLADDTAQQQNNIARARYESELALARQGSASAAGFAARRVEIDRRFTAEQRKIAQDYYSELRRLEAAALAQFKSSKEAQKSLEEEIRNIRKSAEELTFENSVRNKGPITQLLDREVRANEQIKQLREAAGRGDLERARQLRTEIESQARTIAGLDTVFAGETSEKLLKEANQLFEGLALRQIDIENQRAANAQKSLADLRTQIKDVEGLIQNLSTPINLNIGVADGELQELRSRIQQALGTPFQIAVTPVTGAAPAFASGGVVPGTAPHARADNQLIRATPGEFVHRVAAVRKYGVGFMEQVNNLSLPRFADGGLVGGALGEASEKSELSLTINGRRIGSVFGPRDTVENLKEALRSMGD